MEEVAAAVAARRRQRQLQQLQQQVVGVVVEQKQERQHGLLGQSAPGKDVLGRDSKVGVQGAHSKL